MMIPPHDPLGGSVPIEFVEDFSPLGVRLRLETNSQEILEACRASFGRDDTPESGLQTAQFVVRLLADELFVAAPPWPDPVFRRHGDAFYVSVGSQNTAVADLGRRDAVGFVSPAMARDTDFLRHTFLECLALTMMTRGSGATHTYIHASAVAKSGKGLIFCGPRESGKSTLAYACARRGFSVVTDDVVYLKAERGLTAWGRPWRLRFLPDCARFFPELREKAESLKAAGKEVVEIDVQELLPGHTQACCDPAALFFLERSSGRVACEPLEPGDALKLLERELVYDPPEVIERHRRAWTALAARGSFTLHCSEDLDAVVDLLERILEARRAEPWTA